MANGEITVKPWTIAIFTLLTGITGAIIKDRVSMATTETATSTQIQELKFNYQRILDDEKDMVKRDEFNQYVKGVQGQLEDIKTVQQDNRNDLRDIKSLLIQKANK